MICCYIPYLTWSNTSRKNFKSDFTTIGYKYIDYRVYNIFDDYISKFVPIKNGWTYI